MRGERHRAGRRIGRSLLAGVYMWDEDGKEYIDASSGPMVSALGHGHPAVVAAIAAQASWLDYAYTRVARNRPNLVYAERLCSLAGRGFEREPDLVRGRARRAR